MPGERAPRANHKYKARKRVDGRWVYDYGKGFGGPKAPADPASDAKPPDASTRADVDEAMAGPGMGDIRAARAAMGPNPDQRRLKMLAAIAAARLRPDKPVVTTDDDVPDLGGGLAGLFPPSRPTVQPGPPAAEAKPEATAKPSATGTIKPPGSKEELMKQVTSIGKWSASTIHNDIRKFSEATGFKLTAEDTGKRIGPNRVAAVKGTAINLLAIRHLVNVIPEMTDMLDISIIASRKNAQATYSSGQRSKNFWGEVISEKAMNKITVHDKDTGHSVIHEFGHFIDHFLGDPKKAQGFSSEVPSSPMRDFVQKVRKSGSYQLWPKQLESMTRFAGYATRADIPFQFQHRLRRVEASERKQMMYYNSSKEIVARFFDCWAHWKLGKMGYDTGVLGTKPDYPVGNFTDDDLAKLSGDFEAALGARLKKSILNALRDLGWLAKHRPSLSLL